MLAACVIAVLAASIGGGGGPPGSDRPSTQRVSLGFLVDRLTLNRVRRVDEDDEQTIGRLIELNRQLQREQRAQSILEARRAWRYAPPRMIGAPLEFLSHRPTHCTVCERSSSRIPGVARQSWPIGCRWR